MVSQYRPDYCTIITNNNTEIGHETRIIPIKHPLPITEFTIRVSWPISVFGPITTCDSKTAELNRRIKINYLASFTMCRSL